MLLLYWTMHAHPSGKTYSRASTLEARVHMQPTQDGAGIELFSFHYDVKIHPFNKQWLVNNLRHEIMPYNYAEEKLQPFMEPLAIPVLLARLEDKIKEKILLWRTLMPVKNFTAPALGLPAVEAFSLEHFRG